MATTKPVNILCIGMGPTPELERLASEGHHVAYSSDDWRTGYDIILGPKLWRYLPDVSDKFIDRIVKEARAAQPPRAKKAKVSKRGTAAS